MNALLAIAGILIPLGAALDVLSRKGAKRAWATAILRSLRRRNLSTIKVSEAFDKYFGVGIFTWRSLLASLILFILSYVIMHIIMHITTPADGANQLTRNLIPKTIFSGFILSIFIIFSVFSDFISYGKTRIFMRTIERLQEIGVTPVLLLADLIASPAIFVIFFSLARTLAYFFVIGTLNTSYSPNEYEFPTFAIAGTLQKSPYPWNAPGSASTPLARAKQDQAALLIQRPERWIDRFAKSYTLEMFPRGQTELTRGVVHIKAEERCVSEQEFNNGTTERAKMMLLNGSRFIAQLTLNNTEISDDNKNNIFSDYQKEFLLGPPLSTNSSCIFKSVHLIETIDMSALSGRISPIDAYLVSVLQTTQELITSIVNKFSDYIIINPTIDLGITLSDIWSIGGKTILGLRKDAEERYYFLKFMERFSITNKDHASFIPFSTLASSSVAASIMFWVFLVWRASLRVLSIIFLGIRRLVPMFRLRTFPFSFLCVSAVLVAAIATLAHTGLRMGWIALWGG